MLCYATLCYTISYHIIPYYTSLKIVPSPFGHHSHAHHAAHDAAHDAACGGGRGSMMGGRSGDRCGRGDRSGRGGRRCGAGAAGQ